MLLLDGAWGSAELARPAVFDFVLFGGSRLARQTPGTLKTENEARQPKANTVQAYSGTVQLHSLACRRRHNSATSLGFKRGYTRHECPSLFTGHSPCTYFQVKRWYGSEVLEELSWLPQPLCGNVVYGELTKLHPMLSLICSSCVRFLSEVWRIA